MRCATSRPAAAAAAVITPTGDPYNLMLLAVPMYLLYELGILLSRFVPKKPLEPAEEVAL